MTSYGPGVLVVVHPLGSHAESRGELARGEPLILRCVETLTAGQDLCDPASDPLGKVVESVRFWWDVSQFFFRLRRETGRSSAQSLNPAAFADLPT